MNQLTINVKKNNREGWCTAVNNHLIKHINNSKGMLDIDNVRICVDVDRNNDVTNLRYAFPIINLLSRNHNKNGLGIEKKNITLQVALQGDDIKGDKERVLQFLRQFHRQKDFEDGGTCVFTCDNNENYEEINLSDIFGVIEYSENDTQNTDKLNKSINLILLSLYGKGFKVDSIVKKLKLDFDENAFCSEKGKFIAPILDVISMSDATNKMNAQRRKNYLGALQNIRQCLDEKAEGKRFNIINDMISEIVDILNRLEGGGKDSSMFSLFYDSQALYNKLVSFIIDTNNQEFLSRVLMDFRIPYKYIFDRAIGICKIVFNEMATKSFLRLDAEGINFNKFIVVISLFLISSFVEEMSKKEIEEFSADSEYIEKIVWDAESYAEGMWQAIENAQRHSCGKTAFFGMRYYKARMDSPLGKMQDRINTRKVLKAKYKYSISGSQNIVDRNKFSDFIEFFILDDALELNDNKIVVKGIIDKINSVEEDEKYLNCEVDSLKTIFELNEGHYRQAQKERFYNIHYGMRWLHSHVEKMGGIIELYSPNESDVRRKKIYIFKPSHNNSKNDEKEYRRNENDDNFSDKLYSTEYSILFSISNEQMNKKDRIGVPKVVIDTPCQREIAFCSVETIGKYEEKNGRYSKRTTANKIKEAMNNEDKSKWNNHHIQLDIVWPDDKKQLSHSWVTEVVAKAVFSYIYTIKKKASNAVIRIAVVFDNDSSEYIKEFVRLFSVFYIKQENKYMKNVQVALCSKYKRVIADGEKDNTKVHFLIAGEDLQTAYRTAMYFLHCDVGASIEYISLLDYLIDERKGNPPIKEIVIYPFDLYLEN